MSTANKHSDEWEAACKRMEAEHPKAATKAKERDPRGACSSTGIVCRCVQRVRRWLGIVP